MSERTAEGLKRDLSSMVAQRDHGQAELHQAQLQAARLTIQFTDVLMTQRKDSTRWEEERENLQRSAEVMSCHRTLNLKKLGT